MIHISDDDVVVATRTEDGRFLLFTCTDLPADPVLPWSGVMLDTGSDGFGIRVRLEASVGDDCWTASDLIELSLARARLEQSRRPGPFVDELAFHLDRALQAEQRRAGAFLAGRLCYLPGSIPSPFQWTEVVRAGNVLPLCPDPECREEGVSPEQLLLVLLQLFADLSQVGRQHRLLPVLREHIAQALHAERRRVAWLRQQSP